MVHGGADMRSLGFDAGLGYISSCVTTRFATQTRRSQRDPRDDGTPAGLRGSNCSANHHTRRIKEARIASGQTRSASFVSLAAVLTDSWPTNYKPIYSGS